MANQADLIWVKSTLKPTADGGEQVAVFDKDDRHPGGEAFVSGPAPVQVFPSPEVSLAISQGRLQQVTREARETRETRETREAREAREANREVAPAVLTVKGKDVK